MNGLNGIRKKQEDWAAIEKASNEKAQEIKDYIANLK